MRYEYDISMNLLKNNNLFSCCSFLQIKAYTLRCVQRAIPVKKAQGNVLYS